MPLLYMQTDQVRSASQTLAQMVENLISNADTLSTSAGSLETAWISDGSSGFLMDYRNLISMIRQLAESADVFHSRIEAEVIEWERMAGGENGLPASNMQPTISAGVGGSLGGGGDGSTSRDPLLNALQWNKYVRNGIQWGIVPAFLALNVHPGADGLIHLTGSRFSKQLFLGKSHFNISHADTLVKQTTKANLIFEAGSLVIDWTIDYEEHRHEGWEAVGKAMLVSAGEAGGGVVGGVIGTKVGAAIGTVLCPGVGTVLGGVIGNVAGSIIGEKVGGDMVDGVMNYKPLWNHTDIDDNLRTALNGAFSWVN